MIERYKYFHRRWLGWFPIQFCMVCGKPYWGGLLRWWWIGGRIRLTSLAWWQDYCSSECCEEEMGRLG